MCGRGIPGFSHFGYLVFPSIMCWKKTNFSPIEQSWHPRQKSTDCKCEFISGLSVLLCWFMSLTLYSLDYCGFIVSFEIRRYELSKFAFFQNCFGSVLGPLNFCMNFRTSLLISEKKPAGILIGDCVEFVGQFEEYCYLNNIESSDP